MPNRVHLIAVPRRPEFFARTLVQAKYSRAIHMRRVKDCLLRLVCFWIR